MQDWSNPYIVLNCTVRISVCDRTKSLKQVHWHALVNLCKCHGFSEVFNIKKRGGGYAYYSTVMSVYVQYVSKFVTIMTFLFEWIMMLNVHL